jgi:hypothetical protein
MHYHYSLRMLCFLCSFLGANASISESPLLTTGLSEPYSVRMISSIISRGQGLAGAEQSGKSTSQIELGIFQSALRNTVDLYSKVYPDRASIWSSYLEESLAGAALSLLNAERDAKYPLDRFSIGNALLHQCVKLLRWFSEPAAEAYRAENWSGTTILPIRPI